MGSPATSRDWHGPQFGSDPLIEPRCETTAHPTAPDHQSSENDRTGPEKEGEGLSCHDRRWLAQVSSPDWRQLSRNILFSLRPPQFLLS